MGPRKVKSEVSAGSDDATMILDYLCEQNRPYSAIEVSANLHNKVTKSQAAKLLRELHQNEKIVERMAGKQAVYHALQGSSHEATPDILAGLRQEFEQLQVQLSSIKEDDKRARASLAALEAKPRLSVLRHNIQQLEEEKQATQARLVSFHDSQAIQLSLEEWAKLEDEWRQWQRHAAVRRRICRELWGRCTEFLPENTSALELWESLGLEGTLQ